MTNWTNLTQAKERLLKDWHKGVFLRAHVLDENLFPLRLPLRHPAGLQLGDAFAQVKVWAQKLQHDLDNLRLPGATLQYKEVQHRIVGRNQVPVALQLADMPTLLAFIRLEKKFSQFNDSCQMVLPGHEKLRVWFAKYPFTVIDNYAQWPALIEVCDWLSTRPRPEIYLRQIDIEGIDTKFVEANRKLLGALFDILLPEAAIDKKFNGISGFANRYGFKEKPITLRFRLLDQTLAMGGLTDLQVRVDEFANLELPVSRVFVTENEINGLVMPEIAKAMVVFGLGYGLDRLAEVAWLKESEIYYWGDIDTHGFAMLNQMRSYFPQTKSLLMDRQTLLQHQKFWGNEPKQTIREMPHLKHEEIQVYQDLLGNRYGSSLRLEQERIPYRFLLAALSTISKTPQV